MATSDSPLNVPNVTLAVARAAGASGGSGSISWTGTVAHGETLTITDAESRFGTRTNVKPLYVNLGAGPSGSSLGRDMGNYLDGAFYTTAHPIGQIPGGITYDHWYENSGLFGPFYFDTGKPLIQYLERYRDYDITTEYALRVDPFTNKTGTLAVGDTLVGQTSGATGVISHLHALYDTINFALGVGSIRTGGALFQKGEILQGPSGSVVNATEYSFNSVQGLWATFNLKTNRFWGGDGAAYGPNNCWIGFQGAEGGLGNARQGVENVPGNSMIWSGSWGTNPYGWTSEEINFQNSSAPGVKDGIFDSYRGAIAYAGEADNKIITHDAANPFPMKMTFLDQASNGVGKSPCLTTLGYACFDDEYSGVYVGDAATRSACTKLVRQPQTAWSPSQIKIYLVESQVPVSGGYYYFRTGRTSWISDTGVQI